MKTYFQRGLLCLFCILFFGCEKQDLLFSSNDLTLKEVRREIETLDIVRRASFNSEGKILDVILGNISTTELDDVKRNYSYTRDDLLSCAPITSINDLPGCYPHLEYSDEGVLLRINGNPFEYDGNKISLYDSAWDGRIIFEFEDDTYAQLTRYEYYRNVSTNPDLAIQKIFQYDGDNIIFIEAKSLNEATGQLETYNTTGYTYDDKINPYKKGHNQIALVTYYHTMLDLSWEQWNLIYRSTNNVLTQTMTFNLNGWSDSTTNYFYEYNSSGYPITKTEERDDFDIVTKFKYYE